MRSATGHINVARSIFAHPMFDDGKPLSDREAWLWLISNAAFRPVQIMARNGRALELLNLDRGPALLFAVISAEGLAVDFREAG